MENTMNVLPQAKKNERHYGLDLCRIVCMLFVIMWHYIETVITYDSNLLSMIFIVHCNTFFLISGYFMSTKTNKISRFIPIWLEIMFYSIACFVVGVLIKEFDYSNDAAWITVFMPLTSGQYWFMTAYFVIYFLSPFFNKVIKAMSKGSHLLLVIFLVTVFAVLNCFFGRNNFLAGYGLNWIWASVIYFIGAYIRLYIDPRKINVWILLVIFFSFCFLHTVASSLLKYGIDQKNRIVLFLFNQGDYFRRYNELFSLGSAISFFLLFSKVKINNKVIQKIIEFFARHSLASYLIHCNFVLSYKFAAAAYKLVALMQPYKWIAYFIYVLFIFFGSIIVDVIRYFLFYPLFANRYYKKFSCFIDELPRRLIDKINNKKKVDSSIAQ